MANDPYSPRPLANWFYLGAVGSQLFMMLGCAAYVVRVTTDPAMLPLDERAAFLAQPLWLTAANAIAVWVGLVGSVLLLLRRKLAEPALMLSLIATLVWLAGLVSLPAMRAAMTTNDLAVALVIAAIMWTIFWFARHSRQRGWLR